MTLQPTPLPMPVRYPTTESWRPGLPAGAWLWSSAVTLLERLRRAVHARARRRRTLHAMRHLDQHILADIGVSRCEIEFMRQGDWRFPSWHVPRGD